MPTHVSTEATRNGPGARDDAKDVILVSGSSGLIGSALIERLAKRFRMIGLDRAGNPFPPKEAECVCIDLTSEESIRRAMERVRYGYGDRIASVVHLAAYYDFAGGPSPLYEDVTVKGTEKFLRVLQDFDVEQFIFSSTNLVYAPTEPGTPLSEEAPLGPTWAYPQSKVKTEKIIHAQRGDIPTVVLRIAGIYSDEGDSIPLTHQMQRIYEKTLTSHFYSGDVSHGNAFLHLDDLIDALVRAIDRRHELPEEVTLNISEAETMSYSEIQNAIGEALYGTAWRTIELPALLAKAGAWAQDLVSDPFIKPWMIDRADDHYEMDIRRAKAVLGWEPKHALRTTLPTIVADLKADPEAWYEKNHLHEAASSE
ncbi:Nucleoside-diphosphate-sugar epimerase [Catalinimonas alkaloidigena]|uniref:Nucleoside-diphosphate-sugar epimerase n=1 Tax=Catalinimonas alkaloidigena TaxID=1075417 RepID=A0A1G8XNG7_9BACT|nr:NAD(P)-dependent oxidoreductase [Catalinimonas alkaloidigena]SDJ92121.1 Nucleoside-diphosphate-sugar epimerase [Catalinimonas alkaloidigena]